MSSPVSMNIATFPTTETIKMLARLLDQMTRANDRLKAVVAGQQYPQPQNLEHRPTEDNHHPTLQTQTDQNSSDNGNAKVQVSAQSTTAAALPSTSQTSPPPQPPSQAALPSQPTSTASPSPPPPPPSHNHRTDATQSTSRPTPSSAFTRFHARSIPSIDIFSYLQRILKYCPCANECFLSLMVYFDRMSRHYSVTPQTPTTPNGEHYTAEKTAVGNATVGSESRSEQRHPDSTDSSNATVTFAIDSYNVHRLLISGLMVSAKYFSDVFFTNSRYAKVGGLPVSELNLLEVEFLRLNDFSLCVSVEELQRYGDLLLRHSMSDLRVRQSLVDLKLVPSSSFPEDWGPPNQLPLYSTTTTSLQSNAAAAEIKTDKTPAAATSPQVAETSRTEAHLLTTASTTSTSSNRPIPSHETNHNPEPTPVSSVLA